MLSQMPKRFSSLKERFQWLEENDYIRRNFYE